jgi:hypothetical protein
LTPTFPTRFGPCDPAAKPGFLSWGCPKSAPPSYRIEESDSQLFRRASPRRVSAPRIGPASPCAPWAPRLALAPRQRIAAKSPRSSLPFHPVALLRPRRSFVAPRSRRTLRRRTVPNLRVATETFASIAPETFASSSPVTLLRDAVRFEENHPHSAPGRPGIPLV